MALKLREPPPIKVKLRPHKVNYLHILVNTKALHLIYMYIAHHLRHVGPRE